MVSFDLPCPKTENKHVAEADCVNKKCVFYLSIAAMSFCLHPEANGEDEKVLFAEPACVCKGANVE